MYPSLSDNYFQQDMGMLNPWANQAQQSYNPYQANMAYQPYGQALTPRGSLTANPNLFAQSLYGLTDRDIPYPPFDNLPPSDAGGPISFPPDYIPGSGQPGGWYDPQFGGGVQIPGAPPAIGNRYGQPPFPPEWDYAWPGFPAGYPAGQTVGGVGGRYVLPIPGWTPPTGSTPARGIGDPGFRWPWESGGMFSAINTQDPQVALPLMDWMLNAIGQQRSGVEWNQQFNENQRLNNIQAAMDMANLIWGQQQQAAQFGEGQYQFDVGAGLQQQDRDLAQQMQDFNQQQQTGYVRDARTGQYVPTQQMRQQIDQMYIARGQVPVQNPDGTYVMQVNTNPDTGEVSLMPVFANTLEQNQYIANMFGGRMVGGQWQETLPMNQFITGTAQQTGWTPTWNPDTNDWVRWSSKGVGGDGTPHEAGDLIMQPTEAHSERIAQQFGYRTVGGVKEKTLEAQYQDIIRARERAAQTGTFSDPVTGKTQDTLDKMRQQLEAAIAVAGQTGTLTYTNPWTGQKVVDETLAKDLQDFQIAQGMAGLTGEYNGAQTVTEQQRQYENMLRTQAQQSDIASQAGYVYDPFTYNRTKTLGREAQEAALTGKYGTAQTVAEQQRLWENQQAILARSEQLGLAAAGLTGKYGNQQTQQAQQQAWQQGYQGRQQQAELLGTYNGAETVAEQQRRYQNMLATQAQYSDILGQTGYIYDPYTNQTRQTLAGQQQGWGQQFQTRGQAQDYAAVRAGLTGQFEGQNTMANTQRQWENWWAQQQQQAAQQNLGGWYTDPVTFQPKQTLAGQQQQWGQGFQQSEADRQNALAAAGLTGLYQGQQTLAGQQAQRDWLGQQANLMGYWPGTTTGQTGGGTGGDYTPGSGQPGGGTNPQTGENWGTGTQPANPWAIGQPTMAMQQQLWGQNVQHPDLMAVQRRGQNYAAFGRATPRNVNWG